MIKLITPTDLQASTIELGQLKQNHFIFWCRWADQIGDDGNHTANACVLIETVTIARGKNGYLQIQSALNKVCVCARARARVCVCMCVCVCFGAGAGPAAARRRFSDVVRRRPR